MGLTTAKVLIAVAAVFVAIGVSSNSQPASGWSSLPLIDTHEYLTRQVIEWFAADGWTFQGETIVAEDWEQLWTWAGGEPPAPPYHRVGSSQEEFCGVYYGDRKKAKCKGGYDVLGAEYGASEEAFFAGLFLDAYERSGRRSDLKWAMRSAGYASHYAQDAVNPPHVDPWREGLGLRRWAPHTSFERHVGQNWQLYQPNEADTHTQISILDGRVAGVATSEEERESFTSDQHLRDTIKDFASATDRDWDGPPGEDYPTCPAGEEQTICGKARNEDTRWPDYDPRNACPNNNWRCHDGAIGMALQRAAALTEAILIYVFDFAPPVAVGDLIVNTTDDTDDGTCDAAHCSLREAINAANSNPGPDTVTFDPAVFPPAAPATISVTPAFFGLPFLVDDGTRIDGSDAGAIIDGGGSVGEGIRIEGASDSTIKEVTIQGFDRQGIYIVAGGAGTRAERNTVTSSVLAGNGEGVTIDAYSGGAAVHNTIAGNSIIDNRPDPPAAGVGVKIESGGGGAADENLVQDNDIAGNTFGIEIHAFDAGSSANENRLVGNDITDNGIAGFAGGGVGIVAVSAGAVSNNLIQDNVIANNDGRGIGTDGANNGGTIAGNTFSRNSIFGNSGLGIDLNPLGVTPNDPGDADTGDNDLLNFPVIATATTGLVQGTACPGCTIEIFKSDGDPSGHGEGMTFLQSGVADGSGIFTLAVAGLQPGDLLTATATDPAGNTSEFSENVAVSAPLPDWGEIPP